MRKWVVFREQRTKAINKYVEAKAKLKRATTFSKYLSRLIKVKEVY